MKFPICEKCLRSELVCDSCAKIVAEAGIKEKEIKMMKLLKKRMKKYDILKGVTIKRSVDNGNMVVIVADRKSASLLIGKNGGMIKKLGEEIGRQLRVVADSSEVEEFISELFYGTHILGVNVIYRGGEEVYKINIPKSEKDSLPIEAEEFSKISGMILNHEVELVFV